MLGFCINFADAKKRQTMPSGLLVIHPDTGHVIAIGESSLSTSLLTLYLNGLEYKELDHLRNLSTVKCHKRHLPSFTAVAPKYFARAGLRVTKVSLKIPLSGFVPLDIDLNSAYDRTPFEKIKIGAPP